MSSSFSNVFTSMGIVILLHSAYSCLHYRFLLTNTGSTIDFDTLTTPTITSSTCSSSNSINLDPSKPPQDVVLECMIGFFLCLLGQIMAKGQFLPVSGEGRKEVYAPVHVGRDFDLFCTRQGILNQVKCSK
eukprot:CAMPEP_0176495550 /NCGR_PEP_ID=MMETSP0200_2-20121128/10716_1 /TAXON_ID=947934 /ORGANISM="Chaetoceros sp., Strain GSL56" /LENGTH=130 /DNA_ID=CAMNT_0017893435 /DNA_START=1469 /DNA_END=1861 /DNA_ORIENTATION=-